MYSVKCCIDFKTLYSAAWDVAYCVCRSASSLWPNLAYVTPDSLVLSTVSQLWWAAIHAGWSTATFCVLPGNSFTGCGLGVEDQQNDLREVRSYSVWFTFVGLCQRRNLTIKPTNIRRNITRNWRHFCRSWNWIPKQTCSSLLPSGCRSVSEMLQHVLQCCSMCCNVAARVAMLQHVLQCCSTCCNAAACVAMLQHVLQCCSMCCNVAACVAMWHFMLVRLDLTWCKICRNKAIVLGGLVIYCYVFTAHSRLAIRL